MHTVTVAEAKERFTQLIEEVKHGEVIQIMDGETPVGRLLPLNSSSMAFERVGFLQGQGKVPRNWKELGPDESGTDS